MKTRLQPVGIGVSWDVPWEVKDSTRKSFEAFAKPYEFVEVLPPRSVSRISELEKLPLDISAFAVGEFGNPPLLVHLSRLGKPIVPLWDESGYPSVRTHLRDIVEDAGGCCLYPFGVEDAERVLRVLRAMTFLRNLRVLGIGSLAGGRSYYSMVDTWDVDDMSIRFGMQFKEIEIERYYSAIEQADEEEAKRIAEKWSSGAEVLDRRDEKMTTYAKIYVALKKLLADYDATALCVSCDYRPKDRTHVCGIDLHTQMNEFVPCWSYANLIDEGVPCFCKGDTTQLIAMSMLMGLSGGPALMGDLFREGYHQQSIEDNIITIHHDVVPPSMGDKNRRLRLRDMHNRKMGLTGFIELEQGRTVTVAGMNRDKTEMWCCSGNVVWTRDIEDGVDGCRVRVAVKVKDSSRICREHVGEHHVLAYGDWTEDIELLGRALRIKMRNLTKG